MFNGNRLFGKCNFDGNGSLVQYRFHGNRTSLTMC